jgi:hypothetical protein
MSTEFQLKLVAAASVIRWLMGFNPSIDASRKYAGLGGRAADRCALGFVGNASAAQAHAVRASTHRENP